MHMSCILVDNSIIMQETVWSTKFPKIHVNVHDNPIHSHYTHNANCKKIYRSAMHAAHAPKHVQVEHVLISCTCSV